MEEESEYQKESRRVRKDSKKKAKGTKTHDPKIEYDRRDRSWVDEQDLNGDKDE